MDSQEYRKKITACVVSKGLPPPRYHGNYLVFEALNGKKATVGYEPYGKPEHYLRYAKGVLTTLLGTAKPRSPPSGRSRHPSRNIVDGWIHASPLGSVEHAQEESSGKWMMFIAPNKVDDTWLNVRNALQERRLSPAIAAKVSTALSSSGCPHVLCVYLADSEDQVAAMIVRQKLRMLGFKKKIHFKRDSMTLEGVSGSDFSA